MTITTINTMQAVIGWPQMVLIAVVVLLLFGGKKIPELMKGLGKGVKEFKNATNDDDNEDLDKLDK
jgi:sec-independent protein translocase protein TatA